MLQLPLMRLIDNKKLHLSYSITETLEAGIELVGFEVKTLRQKLGSLEGARIIIRGGEAFLIGSYIPPYQTNNTDRSYDPYRTRRLLLKKSELFKLAAIEQQKTLTLAPQSLYLKHNLVKCEIAICKKKTTHDKREDIKKTISRRELRTQE